MLCYCFHQKTLLFFLWRKDSCAVTPSRSFSFHLQKRKKQTKKPLVLTSSLPPLHASVCLCVCSQDIQVECFSSNAFSSWRTVDFRRWGLWIGIFRPPTPTHTLAHTRKHRKKQQSAFQLCGTGRPTDGTLSWWSTAIYRNNLSKWTTVVFWGPHNYLVVAAVVKRLSSKLAQC